MVSTKTEAPEPPVIAPEDQFVHLHLHSEYSLLDGGNRIDRLVNRVKQLGMTSVAVTDHGNLFGAMAFYSAARSAGIKPILGCEAYVAPGDRTERTHTGVMDGGYHLVLLAENLTGWRNLLYLASEAYLTGFYYKPRMDHDLLRAHSEGLIAINGHLGSEIAFHLVEYEKTKDESHYQRACEVARWHKETFAPGATGPRFYVELQHHIPEQNAINPHLIRLAQEVDVPIVCDNDAHFLLQEDHDAHDSLICISMGKVKSDPNRFHYPAQLYVKSPKEMRSMFVEHYGDIGREACDNTVRIADRCNVDLEFENHAPVVRINRPTDLLRYDNEPNRTDWYKRFSAQFDLEPFDQDNDPTSKEELEAQCDIALRDLCEAGLIWRYGAAAAADHVKSDACAKAPASTGLTEENVAEYRARLDRELRILADKQISAYFLIVWDFVNWARQRGIPANARGSGVGTMVGYLLGLSNACPVRYGLLFERFTDPDRSEYPDIDIDLCQDGRGEVINYVREKYGHVAQIITFGTLKARAAIRDIGRVMDMPLPEVDRIAKLVPEQLKMTLTKAMKEEPELKELYDNDPQVRRVIDTGKVIEGQARHSSVHAAGVIVATQPLHTIVPLYKAPGSDDTVTQWDGPTCERVGLLKMDFLGLRTLSTIERAKKLIRETLTDSEIRKAINEEDLDPGIDPLDLERLDFRDDRVFEMFRLGDTTGVFQFESGGMRRLLTEMKPDRLEDLIAANALFRPGPMDLIPDYNARKHGREAVPKIHEIVDRFTEETYGVMVYQEQVMQIVHELGGIPLRAAYSLIKAISKKKHDVIDANRPRFIEGAIDKGLKKEAAEELFGLILKFAGYGFNKSHSSGYAIVAYQTAFLKTYFPNQYMAAFLTYESQAQKVEDWIRYKDDCRRTRFTNGDVGVDIHPPDINLSDADFTVVFDDDEPHDAWHGHVRFGLKAIKGAGGKAIEAIVHERRGNGPYASLHEFCERIPPGTVNKATIESLVTCGAFDSVHGRDQRAAMVNTIDSAVAAGAELARDRAAGQGGLFGGGGFGDEEPAPAEDNRPTPPLSRAKPWDEATMLAREKEVLGFYVSSHPLDRYQSRIECFGNTDSVSISDVGQDQLVIIGGLIKSVRPIVIRNGKSAGDRMAIVTFEDLKGAIDAVLFASTYKTFGASLATDSIVFISGRVDHSRGDPQVIVDRVVPVDEAAASFATRVDVEVSGAAKNEAMAVMDQLSGLIQSQPPVGSDAAVVPLRIVVQAADRRIHVETKQKCITPTEDFLGHLGRIVGHDAVHVRGGRPIEVAPRRRQFNRKPATAGA